MLNLMLFLRLMGGWVDGQFEEAHVGQGRDPTLRPFLPINPLTH